MKINKEAHDEIKRQMALMGEQIFSNYVNAKNENNPKYDVECLKHTLRYSPYDFQIQRHPKNNWGEFTITYHEVKFRDEKYSYLKMDDSFVDDWKIGQLQKITNLTGHDTYLNMIYPTDKTMLTWKIDPNKTYKTKDNVIVNWRSASLAANEDIYVKKNIVLLPNDEAIKIRLDGFI